MKTKTLVKPKPRSKAAKIALLRRSAAGKAVHHRRRLHKHATWHFYAFGLLLFGFLVTAGVFANLADEVIPPPSPPINMDAYIQAIANQEKQQPTVKPPDQIGVGSWYALGLAAPDAQTCASRTFPRGTYLKVQDLRNGRQVVCLVNDYGPVAGTNRVIDLSRGSYVQLEGLGSGTLPAEIWVTSAPQ